MMRTMTTKTTAVDPPKNDIIGNKSRRGPPPVPLSAPTRGGNQDGHLPSSFPASEMNSSAYDRSLLLVSPRRRSDDINQPPPLPEAPRQPPVMSRNPLVAANPFNVDERDDDMREVSARQRQQTNYHDEGSGSSGLNSHVPPQSPSLFWRQRHVLQEESNHKHHQHHSIAAVDRPSPSGGQSPSSRARTPRDMHQLGSKVFSEQHPLNNLTMKEAEEFVHQQSGGELRQRLYTPFLSFTREEDKQLYRMQMKTQPPYMPIMVMAILMICLVHLHFWFSTIFSSTGLFFATGLYTLGAIPFIMALFVAHGIVLSGATTSAGQHTTRLGRMSNYILFHAFGGEYDSFVLLLNVMCLGLLLISRVDAGECMIGEKRGMPVEYSMFSWWWSDDVSTRLPLLGCNPEATIGLLPQESVMVLFVVPTFFQVGVKGCSKYAVLTAWCLSLFFVIFSAVRLDNLTGNVWVMTWPVVFLFIQYELERYKMASFLSNKLALEIATAKEKVEYEQKVAAALADREREAQEKEQELLRNLIGNVAHDMKTPLLSMTMGLEDLRATLHELAAAYGYGDQEQEQEQPRGGQGAAREDMTQLATASTTANARQRSSSESPAEEGHNNNANKNDARGSHLASEGEGESSEVTSRRAARAQQEEESQQEVRTVVVHRMAHTQHHHQLFHTAAETLTNIDVSCAFMTMSINRAIDFAKVSRDVALVPKIESVDVIHAIESQLHCINSLRASDSSPIAVLDTSILMVLRSLNTTIFTDKQWLIENVLCLLSNAMKFSEDNTTVTVRIELDAFHKLPMPRFRRARSWKRPGAPMVDEIFATVRDFHSQFIQSGVATPSRALHPPRTPSSELASKRKDSAVLNRHSMPVSDMQAGDMSTSFNKVDAGSSNGAASKRASTPNNTNSHPQHANPVSGRYRGGGTGRGGLQGGGVAVEAVPPLTSAAEDQDRVSSPRINPIAGAAARSILKGSSVRWSSIPASRRQQQKMPVCTNRIAPSGDDFIAEDPLRGDDHYVPLADGHKTTRSSVVSRVGAAVLFGKAESAAGAAEDRGRSFASSSSPSMSALVRGRGTAPGVASGGGNDADNILSSGALWTDMLRISVEDRGPGLSEEAMDKLFQPLNQGQRFTGGTGLGLFSLAKRTEALGGRCGVHAREDGQSGCVFWFAIPYRPDYSSTLSAADPPLWGTRSVINEDDKKSATPRSYGIHAGTPHYPNIPRGRLLPHSILPEIAERKSRPPSTIAADHDQRLVAAKHDDSSGRPAGDTAKETPHENGANPLVSAMASPVPTTHPASAAQTPTPTYDELPTGPPAAAFHFFTAAALEGEASTCEQVADDRTSGTRTAVQSPKQSSTKQTTSGATSSFTKGHLRILAVDDAQTVLRIVSRTLEKQGFIVDTAKNGSIALDKMIRANILNHRMLGSSSRKSSPRGGTPLANMEEEVLLAAGIPPAANDTSFLLDHGEGHKIVVRRAGAGSPGGLAGSSSGHGSSPREAINDGDQSSPKTLHEELSAPYDVVLTDIQMPVMDGIEATRKYRHREMEITLLASDDKCSFESHHHHDSSVDDRGAVVPELTTSSSTRGRRANGCAPLATITNSPASTLTKAGLGAEKPGGGAEMHSTLSWKQNSGLMLQQYPSGETSGFVKKLRTQRLLIIGMSANSDSETQRLAKEAGMDHFLEKPFVLADFMKVIAQNKFT